MAHPNHNPTVSIAPLLKRLSTLDSARQVSAHEIAAAVALVFTNSISPVPFALLLWALHTTGQDHSPEVLAACAASMRGAAAQVNTAALRQVVKQKAKAEGAYRGGLCDIVGTGGDGHNTYNVSTTASILASASLLIAKHGNNSSTSLSGSADLLQHAKPTAPQIAATTARNLPHIYSRTNYAFLYAREWHPGMRFAAATRKEVPVRTIFNLLGPLANPVHDTNLVEARVLGVARCSIGPHFAEALRLSGARKALVVCGEEDLDELSCAGPTRCWYIRESHDKTVVNEDGEEEKEVVIEEFVLTPEDFGLPRHPLSSVHGGKGPGENAEILMKILRNELPRDDPVLHFVLLNTAVLLTLSGICEAESSSVGSRNDGEVLTERGPGGLRWREGLRRARWCVESGEALRQWEGFVAVTNELAG
ncbi:anthranilate phosphoribosyltransferase [Friedmanniomyces endolithicus]|uniref:Anthranilate phosphoribosyltransferase n=1 Tax=Friedmanniomyces endolithicus TaxID=329885 RepID=A0AAN6HFK3_9PEZI|nr:anthranilate phosphoribosyltransferase [Friedmanniomyces endolithicus]KAK0273924.1 anthranilate phosphoribosyltransferase [Friedmanniomyces endolithicus]KAK0305309.1 anthranilate phosphoribosyltransferase [Friedmanniomyces endolithicus]KAK0307720.1 anthranilate phosphoribosyltransferase [Friedmanniomyces endolithicus]KAK0823344.1 anthranilate phosphoribosyltransferase [Friedmanniomyces endolithicus]